MNINFAFIRHGYGCHNAMSSLVKGNIISVNQARSLLGQSDTSSNLTPMNDPVLTPIGVDASITNGCIVSKVIKKIPQVTGKNKMEMNTINIVGSSPLIRCMETAYYMTRKWENPPDKIYVFPLLREIDEESSNKYSPKSIHRMNTLSSYAMKPLDEQKKYLKSIGILDFFDFTFVEKYKEERMEPGDIKQFMIWFGKFFMPSVKSNDNNNLNLFITTHAGVLRDFSNEGFVNNSGFVVNTTYDRESKTFSFGDYISLNKYLPKWFFYDYANPEYNKKDYYCPSNRCGELCSIAKGPEQSKRSEIKLHCNNPDEQPVSLQRKGAIKKRIDEISPNWDF